MSAYSACITNIEPERITVCTTTARHRHRPATLPLSRSALSVAALAATLLASATAGAQATGSAGTSPAVPVASTAAPASGPDLQGLWDFTMRVGDRPSPGFLALGPVDGEWAGSITLYLTNTLAIRSLTVVGDSVRMVVASREGDVVFRARLTDDGSTMQGMVDYHGGARHPMVAVRRGRPAVPR